MKEFFKKNLFLIVGGLGLYLLSTGISYAAFSRLRPAMVSPLAPPPVTQEGGFKVELSAPKTEACPLTGVKYTKSEKDTWEKLRPLTVMIENHHESRPQSGLSHADIVYEAVAEGGITRFLAVFYCDIIAHARSGVYDLGPVRSARTYYLDWASEYGDYPLYTHVGGAHCSPTYDGGPCTTDRKAQALEQIAAYGWKNQGTWSDLDQFSLGYTICRREPERTGKTVATEHSMYCGSFALWQEALERGLGRTDEEGNPWDEDFVAWKFKEDESSGKSISPEFNFWEGYQEYKVKWEYDSDGNNYKRVNAGNALVDHNNQEQLKAKNVVIQFTRERATGDPNKHLLYTTTGSGNALIFQDGQVIKGKWSKKDRKTRTIFTDLSGKEIKFNAGQIWIEILPIGSEVNY
jgi:hypothetical protein